MLSLRAQVFNLQDGKYEGTNKLDEKYSHLLHFKSATKGFCSAHISSLMDKALVILQG